MTATQTTTTKPKRAALAKTPAKPKGITAKTGSAPVSSATLRAINPKGNTVLKDFGRVLRDEPHKYIYPIKLYLVRNKVRQESVMNWLRERYINAEGGRNHGARYEVRGYSIATEGGKKSTIRYVDYILLEQMTEDERMMFTLEFGQVTDTKIVRDGKLRRPRLNKEQKKELDSVINDYYLRVAAERRQEQDELIERRSGGNVVA